MIRVIWNSPSVTAGRMIALRPEPVSNPVLQKPSWITSPRPNDGSTCKVTANTKMSRIPIRNVGSEMPISDTARNSFESQDCRLSAV